MVNRLVSSEQTVSQSGQKNDITYLQCIPKACTSADLVAMDNVRAVYAPPPPPPLPSRVAGGVRVWLIPQLPRGGTFAACAMVWHHIQIAGVRPQAFVSSCRPGYTCASSTGCGLSAGAIAGIVIGVLGAIALTVAAYYYFSKSVAAALLWTHGMVCGVQGGTAERRSWPGVQPSSGPCDVDSQFLSMPSFVFLVLVLQQRNWQVSAHPIAHASARCATHDQGVVGRRLQGAERANQVAALRAWCGEVPRSQAPM